MKKSTSSVAEHRKSPHVIGVCALLIVHYLLAFNSMSGKSLVFDETVHIAGGAAIWKQSDYRIQPENGLLPQLWATFPLAFDRQITMVSPSSSQNQGKDKWTLAREFFFNSGNDPGRIVLIARGTIIFLSLLLGISVFWLAKRLFGYRGAYISLFLYTFSPNVLAHARLVTSDLSLSLFLILCSVAIWLVLKKLTMPRMLFLVVSASLLFLAKMSAVLIVPIAFLMVIIRLLDSTPFELQYKAHHKHLEHFHQKLTVLLVIGVACGVCIWIAIWTVYGFRYSMLNDETNRKLSPDCDWRKITSDDSTLVIRAVSLARRIRFLPEGYLYGFAHAIHHSGKRTAFLNGELRNTGWWYFFPYCALVKTPIAIMLLAVIALFAIAARAKEKGMTARKLTKVLIHSDLPAVPLAALVLVYLLFSIASNLNIGSRHILVCYPIMFILCGGSAYMLKKKFSLKLIPVYMLFLWLVVDNATVYPDYLAYFNRFAGGPEKGYRHLVDSSLDWGQDLKGFRDWIEEFRMNNPSEDVYFSYFGTAVPEYYKLDVHYLPCFLTDQKPTNVRYLPGTYCISATMLQQVYSNWFFNWSAKLEKDLFLCQRKIKGLQRTLQETDEPQERARTVTLLGKYVELKQRLKFAKLCYYLRSGEPETNIGYSILIYKVTEQEISKLGLEDSLPGLKQQNEPR